MPKFTYEPSPKALAGLQAEVDRYNGNNGASLTVQEWIALHLDEVAIMPELSAAIEGLRKQHEADAQAALQAAVTAARDQLLASLTGPAIAGSEPE